MKGQANAYNKERFKSILLVVLFLTTVLLLYFFWSNPKGEPFIKSPPSQQALPLPVDLVMVPSETVVYSGGNTYEIAKEGFPLLAKSLLDTCAADGTALTEITEAQYLEVMAFPSLWSDFPYYLPFSSFCEAYGIKRVPGSDSISTISRISYSLGSKDSLFIYDSTNNTYYRTVGGKNIKPQNQLEMFIEETSDTGGNTCFPLWTYLGNNLGNNTLVPLSLESTARDLAFTKDVNWEGQDSALPFIKTFFKRSFDFIRKIEEENGTIIYMYGYGEKIFIASPDGSLTYKEEIPLKGLSNVGYLDSLKAALLFVSEHGGFETREGTEFSPFISHAWYDGENKRYGFHFSYRLGDQPVFYQDKSPIIIEVTGGKVNFFYRNLLNYNDETLTTAQGNESQAFSAINVLAENYMYMYEAENREGGSLGRGLITDLPGFESVVKNVSGLNHGYVRLSDPRSTTLKPAWIISLGNMDFYFDLFTAKPLGYALKEGGR